MDETTEPQPVDPPPTDPTPPGEEQGELYDGGAIPEATPEPTPEENGEEEVA